MKIIKADSTKPLFQGDIMLTRVKALPKEAKLQKGNIVAHSESGHHHVAERAQVFTVPDGETLYLRALGKEVRLVHKRSYDTHEPIALQTQPGDVFKIRRQREHTPEGWRRVED